MRYNKLCIFCNDTHGGLRYETYRKLAALAMAVLLAVSLTACSPKQVAQDMVVHLVHKLGLVEESDEDDTDHHHKGARPAAAWSSLPRWTPPRPAL